MKLKIKKRWHVIIRIVTISTLLILSLSYVKFLKNKHEDVIIKSLSQKVLRKTAASITVKIFDKNFLGSGILIHKQGKDYILLTNDHVLRAGKPPYKIQTHDNKIHSAKVMLRSSSVENNDLATLQIHSSNNYTIAELETLIEINEEVIAAGFTLSNTENNKNLNKPILRFGQVRIVLDKALKDGYQIGYTNNIDKGMSGGPLFNLQGKVIAVNGMHSYPLWGDPYIYVDHSVPEKKLHQQMIHYSWGIPTQTFEKFFIR